MQAVSTQPMVMATFKSKTFILYFTERNTWFKEVSLLLITNVSDWYHISLFLFSVELWLPLTGEGSALIGVFDGCVGFSSSDHSVTNEGISTQR